MSKAFPHRWIVGVVAAFALLMCGGASAFGTSGAAQGILDALAGSLSVNVRQVHGAVADGRQPLAKLRIKPSEWIEIAQAFTEALDVMGKSGARRAAHIARLKELGMEEEPMSEAGVAFEIDVMNNRFAFDRYGCLHFDDRFVNDEERPALRKVESLYRRFHRRWVTEVQRGVSGKAGAARDGKTVRDSHDDGLDIADRMKEWRVRRVPVFRGFEDDRYQEHDALIVRCVDEFNRNRTAWAGATQSQGRKIPMLTTALVKSHMIEETGGRDDRSLAAWDADPIQVNVPGDWSDAKTDVGLVKPKKRNEGTAEQNIKAAIKFLVRKGFGVSGQCAAKRPSGTFDGWQTALKRYNGRNADTVGGKAYSEVYAEHIVSRAKDPDRFVAIRKRVDAKPQGVEQK